MCPNTFTSAGFDVIPVPVYYPHATAILGKRVYRRLTDIPGDIDLVDVFRRSHDIYGHVEDMLAKKPKAVWFSPAYETRMWRKNSPGQASKSCKTAV